jgi:hypothetical protein
MLNKLLVNKLTLFFVIVFSISFFQFKYFNEGNGKYIQFIFLAAIEAISIIYIFRTKGPFVFSVQLISLSIFFSMFIAYFSWGQGWLDNFKATVPYMLWLFFFYLMHIKLSIKFIEKTIVFFGLLYIVLYFFQFANSDIVFFGYANDFSDNKRGILRIIFPGGGVFFLTVFIALTKLTDNQNKYFLFWLLIFILGLVIPILQVTRQLIAAVIIIYFIHFVRGTRLWIKISGITILSVALFLFVNTNNSIVKGLREQQQMDSEAGDDYIRILAAQYFLTDFSPNIVGQILGNGVPYGDKSDYGKFKTNTLWGDYRYYFEDVGLIGTYALFGIFTVIGFIIIWIKSFSIPLPSKYKYLKYYLWFILLTSLTSDTIYKSNYLITNIITVFLYNRIVLSFKET